MTGTVYTCLHTNQSRSYLNHLVYQNILTMYGPRNIKFIKRNFSFTIFYESQKSKARRKNLIILLYRYDSRNLYKMFKLLLHHLLGEYDVNQIEH